MKPLWFWEEPRYTERQIFAGEMAQIKRRAFMPVVFAQLWRATPAMAQLLDDSRSAHAA